MSALQGGDGARGGRRLGLPLAVACFAAMVLAGAQCAQAKTLLGEPLTTDPIGSGGPNILVPHINDDGSETTGSPVAGVLTSVSVRSTGDATSFAVLQVHRDTPFAALMAMYTNVGPDIAIPVPADVTTGGVVTTVPTRQAVHVGDELALYNASATTSSFFLGAGPVPDLCARGAPPHLVGVAINYTTLSCNKWLPLVQGVVEPDVDADGYGDETQDLCPSDATRQTQCAQANVRVAVIAAKGKPGAHAQRSFTIANTGDATADAVVFRIKSSRKLKRLKIVKGCTAAKVSPSICPLGALAPGASVTVKVLAVPKAAKRTRLTATATTTSSESSGADNSAAEIVKFKL